jgi:histone H3/H4
MSFGGLMAEVLVVTSKVKKLIKEKGDMNTSAATIEILSKAIEKLCLKGVESAKADGRKTVMDRDIIIDHI